MPNRLTGQVAIVTGGNSGIGEGAARLFAREGAKVALLARREKEGHAVERSIRDGGGEALFVKVRRLGPRAGGRCGSGRRG